MALFFFSFLSKFCLGPPLFVLNFYRGVALAKDHGSSTISVTSPAFPTGGGQNGSLTSVSLPQGSCGYNVVYHN